MKNRTPAWNLQQTNLVDHLYTAVSVAQKKSSFFKLGPHIWRSHSPIYTTGYLPKAKNLKTAEQPIAIPSSYSINFHNWETTPLMVPASIRALSIKSNVMGLNTQLNVVLLLLHSPMKTGWGRRLSPGPHSTKNHVCA